MTKDETEDIKRHFGVVAEHLDSKIQAVAEGVAANGERIERLQSETRAGFARVDSRFGRLEGETRKGFRDLGARVERLESKQTL